MLIEIHKYGTNCAKFDKLLFLIFMLSFTSIIVLVVSRIISGSTFIIEGSILSSFSAEFNLFLKLEKSIQLTGKIRNSKTIINTL